MTGDSAMHLAAENKHRECVELLAQLNANVEQVNKLKKKNVLLFIFFSRNNLYLDM